MANGGSLSGGFTVLAGWWREALGLVGGAWASNNVGLATIMLISVFGISATLAYLAFMKTPIGKDAGETIPKAISLLLAFSISVFMLYAGYLELLMPFIWLMGLAFVLVLAYFGYAFLKMGYGSARGISRSSGVGSPFGGMKNVYGGVKGAYQRKRQELVDEKRSYLESSDTMKDLSEELINAEKELQFYKKLKKMIIELYSRWGIAPQEAISQYLAGVRAKLIQMKKYTHAELSKDLMHDREINKEINLEIETAKGLEKRAYAIIRTAEIKARPNKKLFSQIRPLIEALRKEIKLIEKINFDEKAKTSLEQKLHKQIENFTKTREKELTVLIKALEKPGTFKNSKGRIIQLITSLETLTIKSAKEIKNMLDAEKAKFVDLKKITAIRKSVDTIENKLKNARIIT